SVKPTVGTWVYKGCYQENVSGSRVLTFRFDVPAGNNAQRCTDLCAANGYGLAGMQYGTECWCDNYMPYGQLRPNSECSFICPGDATEYCGAGNRLTLYENSAGIPPSPSACINWRDGWWSFANNILEAVPKVGGGGITRLFAVGVTVVENNISYHILSTCPAGCIWKDFYNFPLVDGSLHSYSRRSVFPNAGDSPSFIDKFPQDWVSYTGWWCKGAFSLELLEPILLMPLLSLNGDVDSWALCTNTSIEANDRRWDVVWRPRANHPHYILEDCTNVWIQIAPYNGNI
ncbi:WSC domain-containing protein, partial [Coprinopsis sp. MPI-PUGE-AT-0042]